MSRNRAAYMREYRAKRKAERYVPKADTDDPTKPDIWIQRAFAASACIRDLEAEVARLKRELAARPTPGGFNTRPFTPVPKPGKGKAR